MARYNAKVPLWLNFGWRHKITWLFTGVLLTVTVVTVSLWLFWYRPHHKAVAKTPSLVPQNIQQAVTFPVYYPDQTKLPKGYNLETSSFANPVKNGVNYLVSYGNNQKLVFSVQAKPSDNDLSSFRNNFIPLRIHFQSLNGEAEIGAYKNETLVSLPINNGPWIVVTAPLNIDQNQLKQVMNALRD